MKSRGFQARLPSGQGTGARWTTVTAVRCLCGCVVSLIAILAMIVIVSVLFPRLPYLVRTPLGSVALQLSAYAVVFAVVLYFARTGRVTDFRANFGLSRPPTAGSLLATSLGLGLAIAAVYLASLDTVIYRKKLSVIFSEAAPVERIYLVALMVPIGPLIEELILRGFFYRAFRGSFGVTASIGSVLLIHTLAHWSTVSKMWSVLLATGILNIALCLMRERTGNLWHCIACHVAYNAMLSDLGRPVLARIFPNL